MGESSTRGRAIELGLWAMMETRMGDHATGTKLVMARVAFILAALLRWDAGGFFNGFE